MRCVFVGSVVLAVLACSHLTAIAQPAVDRLERRLLDLAQNDDDVGYLGVIANDQTTSGSGVELLEIIAGGAAEKAGLEAGDRVTKIDDKPVRTLDDFAEAMHDRPVGAKLRFTIERNGKPKLADVTLVARPPAESRPFAKFGRIEGAEPPRMSLLGVRVEPVDPDSPVANTLPAPKGAYVVRIAEDSPAAQAKIPLYAVIVAIDGQEVGDPADLKQIISSTRPGQEIKVDYYYRGKLAQRRVTLAEVMPEAPLTQQGVPPEATDLPAEHLNEGDRIEQLERRIRLLEARISELERALGK